MKHLIVIASIMIPTSSLFAMKRSTPDMHTLNGYNSGVKKSYLTIINQLPTHNPNIPNPQIDIFHDNIAGDIVEYYLKNPDAPHASAHTLTPNESTHFSMPKTLINDKPDSLNPDDDSFIIYIYAPVKTESKLFRMYFNKFYPVKYGDTLTFQLRNNNEIILNRNNDQWPTKSISLAKEENDSSQ